MLGSILMSNLSVQIENILEEAITYEGQSRPQGMKFGNSGVVMLITWDGAVNSSMKTSIVIDKTSKYNSSYNLLRPLISKRYT